MCCCFCSSVVLFAFIETPSVTLHKKSRDLYTETIRDELKFSKIWTFEQTYNIKEGYNSSDNTFDIAYDCLFILILFIFKAWMRRTIQ